MASRLLVVEDDDTIGNGLVRSLAAQGYMVDRAADGAAALELTAERPFALALLDLTLPDLDGVELCRQLRAANPELVIVMLTARSDELDVIIGLDAGADDYIVKPFRLAELLARVRAHLRRPGQTSTNQPMVVGNVVVDLDARRVVAGSHEVALRPKEFELLALLVAEPGRVLSRERIMTEVWDAHWLGSTKTLDMHVSSLRRKLGAAGSDILIATVWGVGYRLEAG